MKIFIYHNLIDNEAIREHNRKIAGIHNLGQHLQYLEDFYNHFRQFETTNPDEADYFFVPLFLTGWQFVNHDPGDFIGQFCVHADKGRHLLVASGDFGQRAQSRYEMQSNPNRAYVRKYDWLDDRFTLLVLESTADLHAQDVAFLPYPIRPIDCPNTGRDIFISFMGAMGYDWLEPSHIRGQRFVEFQAKNTDPAIVIGEVSEVARQLGQPISYHDLMARSIFTLAPAGYGRWSFRHVEALLNGSIPVILADGYVLPFADKINWKDYCIVVAEEDFDAIKAILGAIPIAEIYRLQRNIQRDRHLFEREFSLRSVLERLDKAAWYLPGRSPAERAIQKMRAPTHMGIICLDVTNKCDLACSNCTRLLENQDKFWEMSPENFRLALRSLKGYTGIIAMIGGNPCMHSKFTELCEIFVEEIPNQRQRGLWTNNMFKHQEVIENTFGGLNLNPHNNPKALPKLREVYQRMVIERGFSGGLYEGNSEHSPLLTAVRDLYGETEMWEKISNCDINREWSASIIQNNGELRVYFCEVAAAFDLARNEDHGHPITEGWWNTAIEKFSAQIKHFCPGCGVPARLKGHLDCEEVDTYTDSNSDIALKSVGKKKRKIIHLQQAGANELGHKVTQYAAGAR